jgi:hypothetical protein
VEGDLREGWITEAAATRDYGVVLLQGEVARVDREATERERRARSARRPATSTTTTENPS